MRLFINIPKFTQTPFKLSLLVLAMMILGLLMVYFNLQPQVPIFYSLAQPAQYLAAKQWLFIFPLISLLTILLHLFILQFIKHHERLIIILFAWATAGLQILLGLGLLRIVLIIS